VTTAQRDQAVPARVVVRILDGGGEPVGAGFVIGPDLVATCAHVVTEAVRGDPYDATPPARQVELDLPLLFPDAEDGAARVTAEVARWIPIAPEGTGDIAVLRVRDPLPDGARMPPLRRVDQLWDHEFRVLGFPEGMADGVWATGRFRGRQGTRWFQMQGTAGEQPIVEGFSGSPVWDETSGAVVGMTVATDVGGTTTAYLIPIDLVLGVDPELLPCPYRGLEPFGEEHASFFFGRDDDIDRLADAVTHRPLVAVAGPSGAGKSSLVRAGLLPRLRAQGVQVAELGPLPGRPAEELLAAVAEAVPRDEHGRVVLVVDQFEELAATDPDAAAELLERVRIPDPAGALRRFPHQFSGGQRQRIAIAIALACSPSVLIADEPTTALDVTVQAGVLHLLRDLAREMGLAVLLVTHDLGVMSAVADRVAVMREGEVVENGERHQVFTAPAHDYTASLLASLPGAAGGVRSLDDVRALEES